MLFAARPASTQQLHALLTAGAAHPDAAAESSCAQYSAAQAAVPVKKMWSRVASARGTSAALAAAHNAAAPAAPAPAPPSACSNRFSQGCAWPKRAAQAHATATSPFPKEKVKA